MDQVYNNRNNDILHIDLYPLHLVMCFIGIGGRQITFLFTDTQIVNEGFVEDINNLLNSGEVPGLFTSEEKDRICVDIREYALTLGIPLTKDSLYNCFINRSREFIHVVLCMSPVGESFRSRCRQFPSLINCCTIDWFDDWPEEALLTVSNQFLGTMDLGSDMVSYLFNLTFPTLPVILP